jgi:hypothetical protein
MSGLLLVWHAEIWVMLCFYARSYPAITPICDRKVRRVRNELATFRTVSMFPKAERLKLVRDNSVKPPI